MRYPREIEIQSGRHVLMLIAAIHVIAAFSFAHLFPGSAMIAGLCVIVLSLVLSVRRHHRSRRSLQLVLEDSGELCLSGRDADAPRVALGACTDFGWAVWLRWQGASDPCQGRRGLLFLRSEFALADWRALRIWLRHKAPEAARGPLSGV